MADDARLLAKVATLYYKSQLSQQEIADRLGLSRQRVGRLIQHAHDAGIVHIEIRSPLSYATELEVALEEGFQLAEAVVVAPPLDTDESTKSAIGQATAEFVLRRINSGDILGIVSGSTTLQQFVAHLKPTPIPDLTVVALTGSAPRSGSRTYAQSLVRQVAEAFSGRFVSLPAPAFVDRPDIKTSLLSDSNIAAVLNLAHQANIAVFGIGTISEQSSPYQGGYVDYDLMRTIQSEGGVGEICGHAYDIQGSLCSPEISARTIAVDLENLSTKKLSIAAAGGLHKLDAIWGALQGKFCNMLITDERVAAGLLDRLRRP